MRMMTMTRRRKMRRKKKRKERKKMMMTMTRRRMMRRKKKRKKRKRMSIERMMTMMMTDQQRKNSVLDAGIICLTFLKGIIEFLSLVARRLVCFQLIMLMVDFAMKHLSLALPTKMEMHLFLAE